MADYDDMGLNQGEETCGEELEESICKTDPEEQVYPMDPIEFVVERPASNKSFKEELIKEETKFLKENNGRILVESGLGFCALQCRAFSAVKEQIKNGQIKQYEVKAGVNSEVDSIRTVRFRFSKDDSNYTIEINTENSQSSIALAKKNKTVDVISGPVITNRALFFLDENFDSGIYYVIVYNKIKQWVEIDIDQNRVTDLEIGSEDTVNDCNHAIFRFHKPYDKTVLDFVVSAENDSYLYITSCEQENKIILKEKNSGRNFEGLIDYNLPKGTYYLHVKSSLMQDVRALISLHLRDSLDNEIGGFWVNDDMSKHLQGSLANVVADPYKKTLRLRWYVPKKFAGIIKGMLETKEKNYDSGVFINMFKASANFLSIAVSLVGLWPPASEWMAAVSIGIAVADVFEDKNPYTILLSEFIDKIQGGVGNDRNGMGIEVFRENVVYEENIRYKECRTDYGLMYEPELELSVNVWDTYPIMKGQDGCIGSWTLNDIKEESHNEPEQIIDRN